MIKNLFFPILCLLSLNLNAQLVINEFMASNATTLADEAGEFDDWIEIYNAGSTAVEMEDFYLTDNFSNLTKFEFPETITISGNSYLTIFSDEDGSQGNLHANFKLDREGEQLALVRITASDTTMIDSLSFGNQLTDVSFGRYPDGDLNFEFFTRPTPSAANISDDLLGIAPVPFFSPEGGFYTGSQVITLSSDIEGAVIRYTMDGSEPDESDPAYTIPLEIDSTVVIKAKVFAEDYLSSPVGGKTYFIDEHFLDIDVNDRMYVVSISADPDTLWSREYGLLHADNLWNDWEYGAIIELFEPDGTPVINQAAGIRLFGNSSRRMAQKSIAVIARNEYGSIHFAYPLFKDRPFDIYKSFVLRNSGNDWSETYMRDALCHELIRNSMDIDAQGNLQTVLYVNGEFYGIMNMKEKINEHYLEAHHDIDPDNIDMLQSYGELVSGDSEAYMKFNGFVANNSMGDERLYGHLSSLMEIPEYMNHYITEIFIANIDMSLNQKYWREKENYGKWRWIIYDMEMSFGQGDYAYNDLYGTLPSDNTLDFATVEGYGGTNWPYQQPWSSEKIVSMLDNDAFRNDFIQSFAAHLNTTFRTERVLRIIDSLALRVRQEMPAQIELYGGVEVGFNPYGFHFTTMEEWGFFIDTLYNFAVHRPEFMRDFMLNRFNLEGTYELTPIIADSEFGRILIQNLPVPLDSAGIYFDDVPLDLSAIPKAGYRFVKWTGIETPDSLSKNISLILSEDVTVEAVFEPEKELMISEIYYLPEQGPEYEFIELHNPKYSTALDLTGYSVSGDVEYIFSEGSLIEPGEYLVLAANPELYPEAGNIRTWSTGSLSDHDGIIKIINNEEQIEDSVNYKDTAPWPAALPGYSILLTDPLLDNNSGSNWETSPDPGGTAGVPFYGDEVYSLVINEVQSYNDNFIADEFNEYNDWVEILNTGTVPVDLGGMYITNNLDTPAMYQIPTCAPDITIIRPGEYKLIWADRDTNQGPLHLPFNLNKGGSQVGLSLNGRTYIDTSGYAMVIDANISFGRYADATGDWRFFDHPTPGGFNSLPPEFISEPLLTIPKKTDYSYEILVSDPENDDLYIGIYELPSWLYYITNNEPLRLSGRSPTGNFDPVAVKIFVTDGHTRPVDQEFMITQEFPDMLESITEGDLKIYPNPTNGPVNILANTENSFAVLELFSLSGQLIWREEIFTSVGEQKTSIDLSGFDKGIYLLSLKSERGIVTQKLILY